MTPRLRRTVTRATSTLSLVLLPGGQHGVRYHRPERGPLDIPLRTPAHDVDAAEMAVLGWQLAWLRGELDGVVRVPADRWAYGPGLPSTYTDE